MSVFWTLLVNLLPLYLIIGAGYFAGRVLHIDRQMLARLGLYIFVPVVTFGFVVHLDLRPAYALLPLLTYAISCLIAFSFLQLGRMIYGDGRANLLALCASMGNTGYFGLPLVMLLAPPEWVGVYMFALLGNVIFEGSFGYYIAARGRFTVRESLMKLMHFPSLYAVSLAVMWNLFHLPVPGIFDTYWAHFKGAYVIVGMMIIGAALAGARGFKAEPGFTLLALGGKFFCWPLLILGFVWADMAWFQIFDMNVYRLLIIASIVPPAANITAFASMMDLYPRHAALTVLAGTALALVYIPLMLILLGIA